jgi:hypothetical protein
MLDVPVVMSVRQAGPGPLDESAVLVDSVVGQLRQQRRPALVPSPSPCSTPGAFAASMAAVRACLPAEMSPVGFEDQLGRLVPERGGDLGPVALKRTSTLSWSVDIVLVHCHES